MPTLPADGEKIVVSTPTTSPWALKVGPPELPWFTGGVDLQEVVVGARVRPTGRPCAEFSRLDDSAPMNRPLAGPWRRDGVTLALTAALNLARSSASRPLR